MTASIDIRDAFKTFGHGAQAIHALDKANLTIRPNEFVTFVGASGCGKSTLLRMIGGLESLSRGSIAVNGQPIAGPGGSPGACTGGCKPGRCDHPVGRNRSLGTASRSPATRSSKSRSSTPRGATNDGRSAANRGARLCSDSSVQ